MRVATIVVAAGSGARFGDRKQFLRLGGTRVLDWSLRTAQELTDHVVVVLPPDLAGDREPLADVVVAGGETRSSSVRAGLGAVPAGVDAVLVHDAARPVPVLDVWRRVLDALAMGAEAVVPAVPLTDTLREVGGGTVDRSRFVAVQTPQGFAVDALRQAHADEPEGTDDASLVEAMGGKVLLVDGDPANIKITTPHDLAVADLLTRP